MKNDLVVNIKNDNNAASFPLPRNNVLLSIIWDDQCPPESCSKKESYATENKKNDTTKKSSARYKSGCCRWLFPCLCHRSLSPPKKIGMHAWKMHRRKIRLFISERAQSASYNYCEKQILSECHSKERKFQRTFSMPLLSLFVSSQKNWDACLKDEQTKIKLVCLRRSVKRGLHFHEMFRDNRCFVAG